METLEGLLPGGTVRAVLLFVLWCTWWLFCVNWEKARPMLAHGGWAPVVLLMALVSLVWSFLQPAPCTCLRLVTIPNGWWQLGEVCLLVLLALGCGQLQSFMGWTPWQIAVEPAPETHGHGHGHDHGGATTSHGH